MIRRFAAFARTRSYSQKVGNGERGLTLIEIMVVLVILALVMGFIATRLFGQGDKAKANLTKLKMKDLKQKIGEYRLMYNALPGSLEDLARCNEKTGPGCIPVMSAEDATVYEDAWGGKFVYQLDGNGRTYRITSYGADGRQGGSELDFDFFEEGP